MWLTRFDISQCHEQVTILPINAITRFEFQTFVVLINGNWFISKITISYLKRHTIHVQRTYYKTSIYIYIYMLFSLFFQTFATNVLFGACDYCIGHVCRKLDLVLTLRMNSWFFLLQCIFPFYLFFCLHIYIFKI